MKCNQYDICIEQGATFERTLTIKDSNGVPLDITGWEFTGQIRKTYSDPDVVVSFSFDVLDQTTETGKVKMFLSADDTESIPVTPATGLSFKPTLYVYGVEAKKPDDFVYRFLQGVASVSPEVTRIP